MISNGVIKLYKDSTYCYMDVFKYSIYILFDVVHRNCDHRFRCVGILGLILSSMLVVACTGLDTLRPSIHHKNVDPTPLYDMCSDLYMSLNKTISTHGVHDAQASVIRGFPYLRTNRVLSALALVADDDQLSFLLRQMVTLGRESSFIEIANLPANAKVGYWLVIECTRYLMKFDFGNKTNLRNLREAIKIPTAYSNTSRIFGLYPLASIIFSMGTERLHRNQQLVFDQESKMLKVDGELRSYSPRGAGVQLSHEVIRNILRKSRANAVSLPVPNPSDLQRLFRHYAPIWEVDTVDRSDQIGSIIFGSADQPEVNPEAVVTYTLASHAVIDGEVYLQLSYIIWFSERPSKALLDLFGGRLDGITWRVTLDHDGGIMLYDAIHNCGCYHVVMPTDRVELVNRKIDFEEPLFVPMSLRENQERIVVRLSSADHHIQDVYFDSTERRSYRYALVSYNALRSLPLENGGHRSLFAPSGLIKGTERLERWLFWPSGVLKPGSMRQWGTQAIAFVGQRHFDGAYWIDKYFDKRAP